MNGSRNYSLWMESEDWAAGEWNPADSYTDVIVTFDDGSRWVATFFSYANIRSLTEKNMQTGECLSGAYFRASDMILIEEISRQLIEAVVAHVIAAGKCESVFTRLPNAEGSE
jgi:hypothetical protein